MIRYDPNLPNNIFNSGKLIQERANSNKRMLIKPRALLIGEQKNMYRSIIDLLL